MAATKSPVKNAESEALAKITKSPVPKEIAPKAPAIKSGVNQGVAGTL